jgi:hypothetical protein
MSKSLSITLFQGKAECACREGPFGPGILGSEDAFDCRFSVATSHASLHA